MPSERAHARTPNLARPRRAGVQFTFVRKPHLGFDIRLRGLMFSDFPGLVGELRRRLVSIIAAEAVEPARVWINLKTPFYNLKTRKEVGRKGQLKARRRLACCSAVWALLWMTAPHSRSSRGESV